MVFVLALVFLGLIAVEAPGLIMKRQWRELGAFGGLMVIAMFLSFAEVLQLPIPNPTKGLEMIFNPVAEFIHKLLEVRV